MKFSVIKTKWNLYNLEIFSIVVYNKDDKK